MMAEDADGSVDPRGLGADGGGLVALAEAR